MTRAARCTIEVVADAGRSTLADDVRVGLTLRPRTLPPKHLYDARGAALFERITRTPEYYVTRTEQGLLDEVAPEIAASVARAYRHINGAPTDLVELGSGAGRKTRALIEALQRHTPVRYVPFDVSGEMLRASAERLLSEYPERFTVHGLVADYTRDLARLPPSSGRLVAFLGSTIGNFTEEGAVAFLAGVARAMSGADRLLVGFDLVKAPAVIDAAYNDAEGITAAFNRNVLVVVNRELDADFDVDAFAHGARYVPERARVEMHLQATRDVEARIGALGLSVRMPEGEAIRTEISRKFTEPRVRTLYARAGLALERWFESPDGYFGLALGARMEG